MAGSTGEPVGPFPEGADPDEYDKRRRRVLWTMPSGLYVVGSRSADGLKRNLMTLNWATQVSFEPKLLAIGVEHGAVTHELIADAGTFTVCIIDREDRALIRKFVKPAEPDPDTIETHTTGTPVLKAALAWLDCEVRQAVETGGHTLFIGEVVDAGFHPGKEETTPVLRMEDTRMNYGG